MPTVSNPATLSSVISTFGGPSNLNAYRRGGGVVPNIAAYNAVSTTQPRLSTFAGLTYPPLDLPSSIYVVHEHYNQDQGAFNSEVIVGVELNTNGSGNYYYYDNGTFQFFRTYFTWLQAGSAGDYWAFMDTPAGDSFTSGTVNTPIQISSQLNWELQAQAISPVTGVIKSLTSTLRLRSSSTGTDWVTSQIGLIASAFIGIP